MRCIAQVAFAIELDQIRVPLPVEALRQDVGGLALAPQLHEAPCCRTRYLRMRFGRVGEAAPVLAKPSGVLGEKLELFALSADANVLRLRGVENLAPDKL